MLLCASATGRPPRAHDVYVPGARISARMTHAYPPGNRHAAPASDSAIARRGKLSRGESECLAGRLAHRASTGRPLACGLLCFHASRAMPTSQPSTAAGGVPDGIIAFVLAVVLAAAAGWAMRASVQHVATRRLALLTSGDVPFK